MTETEPTDQPTEYCGHETMLPVSQVSTECVLRPGHSGSHANCEGARWRLARLNVQAEQPADGYCPHCGRGDAGPTADQYEASQRRTIRIQTLLDETRDRARKDAIASRESERILQQQIDAQAREIDRLREALASRPSASCGSCGQRPVTYFAPDGLPACADCAPCDCGTEPCSKPEVIAARQAVIAPPKETP